MFSALVLGNIIFHYLPLVSLWRSPVMSFHIFLSISVNLQNHNGVRDEPSTFYVCIFPSCIDYCLGHIHRVNLVVSSAHSHRIKCQCSNWHCFDAGSIKDIPEIIGRAFCLHPWHQWENFSTFCICSHTLSLQGLKEWSLKFGISWHSLVFPVSPF